MTASLIQGQRHDRSPRSALVLFGSETGNSEDVAGDLGRITERLHFETRVSEMDLVEINELPKYTIVLIAISTTGQGEFPRNAGNFWKSLLRKRLPPTCLSHVSFTSFGLGDSSYPKFNWTARKLHKRLQQLGAQEIYPRGEADEQHEEGIDGTFLNWSAGLRSHLLSVYPLPDGLEPIPPDVFLPPKISLLLANAHDTDTTPQQNMATVATDPENKHAHSQPVESVPQTGESSIGTGIATLNMSSPYDGANDIKTTDSKPDTANAQQPLPLASSSSTMLSSACPSSDPLKIQPTTPASTVAHSDLSSAASMEPTLFQKLFPNNPAPHESNSGDGDQLKGPTTDVEPPSNQIFRPEERPLPIPHSFKTTLFENRRVTPTHHWQDVRELTFTIPDEVYYEPGDVVTIYPKNFPEDVQRLIDLMGWNAIANEPLTFEVKPPLCFAAENWIPGFAMPGLYPLKNTTLQQLLTHNLDITAIPKRHFFELIAQHTDDPTHKQRLSEFSNPYFTDEFYDYTSRPRRSILEVLEDFPSVRLPWKWVCTFFPVIRGRDYSIASGGYLRINMTSQRMPGRPKLDQFQILVAIVKYCTVLKRVRQGLCSRYLASLGDGSQLNIGFRKNTKFFHPASFNPKLPLIMIGPGTGIAPLRSLIWERDYLARDDEGNPIRAHEHGDHYLFFGNRNHNADFFYKEEWNPEINPELQLHVFACFSRDQKEKIYVQDLIIQNGKLLAELLEEHGAIIYLCGSSGKMPKAVRQAFVRVLEEYCKNGGAQSNAKVDHRGKLLSAWRNNVEVGKEAEAAEAYFDSLEKSNRFVQETW